MFFVLFYYDTWRLCFPWGFTQWMIYYLLLYDGRQILFFLPPLPHPKPTFPNVYSSYSFVFDSLLTQLYMIIVFLLWMNLTLLCNDFTSSYVGYDSQISWFYSGPDLRFPSFPHVSCPGLISYLPCHHILSFSRFSSLSLFYGYVDTSNPYIDFVTD